MATLIEEAEEMATLHRRGSGRFGEMPVSEGVYLDLFHGRESPQHNLEDWGSQGPVFGPLDWVHTTYGRHVKIGRAMSNFDGDLFVYYDLIYYDGVYYRDWSVCQYLTPEQQGRVVAYEEEKAKPKG